MVCVGQVSRGVEFMGNMGQQRLCGEMKVVPYIVGTGASAGGLEAFGQFFSHLPPDTGLAFVLLPHVEPTHKGMMPELLARRTEMEVVEVKR
jgi:two-component system, chemotaxis family, CheB/CheR fusion protein